MKDFCQFIFGTDNRDAIIARKVKQLQHRAMAGGAISGEFQMTADECKRLCKACNDFEYLPGYENRVRLYTITDETVDRYGDIVRAKGIKLDSYKKNPVVQFAHDYFQPPIGMALKVWYDKEAQCVKAMPLFYDDRVDTSGRSDLIFRFAKSNGMRACSIGFVPIEFNDPNDAEEREQIGLGKYGVEFTKSDLMEFSPCPVPANPNALQDSYNKEYSEQVARSLKSGLFTQKDVRTLLRYPILADDVIDQFIKELGTGSVMINGEVCEAVGKEYVIKPYENEHACRLQDPGKYSEFRRNKRKHDGKEYSIIWGHVEDSDKWEEQAYRYDKGVWDKADAQKHCKDHGGKFEAAKEDSVTSTTNDNKNIVVNMDVSVIQDKICDLSQQIRMLAGIGDDIGKKLDESVKSFKTEVDKVSAAINTVLSATVANRRKGLYDEEGRIESLLKP